MNNVFTAKLLQNLNNKKGNKGFTLIELLVVVIIIGVLAAVALPNLLAQVGKARETEGKNAVGTVNRGQQAYHFEAGIFSPVIPDTTAGGVAGLDAVTNPLGVAIDSQYYTFTVGKDITAGDFTDPAAPVDPTIADPGDAALGSMIAVPVNASSNGIRGYSGSIAFTSATGLYSTVLCQGSGVAVTPAANTTGNGCADGSALR